MLGLQKRLALRSRGGRSRCCRVLSVRVVWGFGAVWLLRGRLRIKSVSVDRGTDDRQNLALRYKP